MRLSHILTIILLLAFISSANAQTLNDQNIIYQGSMQFRFVDGFDPQGRLFSDFFNDEMLAFPGSQRARTVKAYFNITPMQRGYIYEIEITSRRPPTTFGLFASKCIQTVELNGDCSVIFWRETDSTPGNYRLSPAPSIEQPNPPSFSASPGDRFAIEWTDSGNQPWGSFNYYKNRTLVFSTSQTPPAIPFNIGFGWTIAATFDESTVVQGFIRATEIQYYPY